MNDELLFVITVALTENDALQIHQRHVWASDVDQEPVKKMIAEIMSRVPNPNSTATQTLFTVIPEAVKKN
jgi:hypothetical protein